MAERKKLMVDMDDVICSGGFLYLINKFLGTSYTYDDFKGFYMQDMVPNKDEFFRWFVNQNMYDYCELMPGCDEVLKELNQVYDLSIATDFIVPEIVSKCGYIVMHKFDYLQRELSFIDPRQYIFLANKSVLDMDIKIDDKISNLSNADTKLLFSAFHNREYSDEYLARMRVERMNDWYDVKKRLLRK